jgi:hypothetical protein
MEVNRKGEKSERRPARSQAVDLALQLRQRLRPTLSFRYGLGYTGYLAGRGAQADGRK